MLALCLMHLETYYAQNYAGIIGLCLVAVHSNKFAVRMGKAGAENNHSVVHYYRFPIEREL